MANLQEMIMAALTFNKEGLKSAGEAEDSTTPAIILILIAALLSGVSAYINGTSVLLSFGGGEMTPIGALISEFVGQILIFLLVSWVVAFMLGAEAQTMEVFRIFAATSIWTLLGAIVGLVGLTFGGWLGFIGLICLIFGLSAISGKGMLSVFIRVIIAYILILLLIVFVFIGLFFGLLFAL